MASFILNSARSACLRFRVQTMGRVRTLHMLRLCGAYNLPSMPCSSHADRLLLSAGVWISSRGLPNVGTRPPSHHLPIPAASLSTQQYSDSAASADDGEFKLMYTAPLKGAIRAVKVFSLSTAVAAFFGGPILVWLGNPSVPLVGRVAISTIVMLAGVTTTAVLHWLLKGYVIQLHYNEKSQMVAAYTLSLAARKKRNEFHISEAGPPHNVTSFSAFKAKGKGYFIHTEVFENKKLLSALLGAYSVFEDKKQ